MDIRQQITDDIIKAMEAGPPPWRKSWSSGCLHFNASSGATYKGINQLILGMAASAHGGEARWLTYKQAEYMGLQVRKGESGTRIVKMVEVNRRQAAKESAAGGDVLAEDGSKALVMKAYTVFNASQIDGMAPMPARECDVSCADAVEQIILGLQRTGLKVNFGQGFQPAYHPRTDEVRIPPANEFLSLEDFHATLLHEAAGHATGHPKRLARLHMDARFGSPEYAREELCAELVSSMMQGVIGLPPGPTMLAQHAAYLASWLQALKNDKNEIFKAAAGAQKICDYVSRLAVESQPFVVPEVASPNSDLLMAEELSGNREMVHHRSPIRGPNQEPNWRPRAAC